jgi:hypothetical protein
MVQLVGMLVLRRGEFIGVSWETKSEFETLYLGWYRSE